MRLLERVEADGAHVLADLATGERMTIPGDTPHAIRDALIVQWMAATAPDQATPPGATAGAVEILAAAAAPAEALPATKRRLWWPFNRG